MDSVRSMSKVGVKNDCKLSGSRNWLVGALQLVMRNIAVKAYSEKVERR